MFVLKSLGKLILGNSEQKELLKLPLGTFWKVELDPKDSTKIISRTQMFSDEEASATLILRRGGAPFAYELVVSVLDSASFENESGPFKLRAELSFTHCIRPDKTELFYWNEPVGKDSNVIWEFLFSDINSEDSTTTPVTIEMFQMTAAQCIYETEMKRSQNSASDADISKYILNDHFDEAVTTKATVNSTTNNTINEPVKVFVSAPDASLVIFKSEEASFHVFDSNTGVFVPRNGGKVAALIVRNATKPWEFTLQILSPETPDRFELVHSQLIDPDATQHLDRASFSFIWCHFTSKGDIWTFSLKFEGMSGVLNFANLYNQSVYEALNREKWSKVTAEDARYLLNPMLDVEMTQALPLDFDDSDSSESEDSDSEDSEKEKFTKSSHATPKQSMFKEKQAKNQILSVGYKSDRSFVARGSSIGIFKTDTQGGDLDLVSETTLKFPKGGNQSRPFQLSKMMLHEGDESLLLMNPDSPNSVFKMDLNRGEVVDEWTIHDQAKVTSILPNSKYSQMTGESTFIGLNSNSIFRIDPRLTGNKRVDTEMKSYTVKNEFSCGATTGAGELAVASAKGELRLFNKLDKRAKTLLPMFGDAILGVDTTENGKLILATCKTYLLLIDTELTDGSGDTGFTKSMGGADSKPVPKRLQLKPEHVAYMGSAPSFTPARFSTGQSEERAIITSSGPFVITWNLRRVKLGHLYDYQIKKYEDHVVADNFRYGQDRSIVVTLPESVTMISKKSLAAASPKSLRDPKNIVDHY